MQAYINNHRESYHDLALEEHKEERRPDYFYTKLMKDILAWEKEIYEIGSIVDFNTYIKAISKYKNDLGYKDDMSIYTDNFYSLIAHNYYNDTRNPNHFKTGLNKDVEDALKNYSFVLFSTKKQNQNKYQLTRSMFKFILLVNQYMHHKINIEHIQIQQEDNQSNLNNPKQSIEKNAHRLQGHIKDIINLCGGIEHIQGEIITNGFHKKTFEHLLVMQKYPQQYVIDFTIEKPTIKKAYIENFLSNKGNTKKSIDSFLHSLSVDPRIKPL